MKILTEMQQSGQVVHVIAKNAAKSLIDAGYARQATIDPAPPSGKMAVNLTVQGKSFTPATEPESE